jgi:tetratricopeptide (TPR) repeat protein
MDRKTGLLQGLALLVAMLAASAAWAQTSRVDFTILDPREGKPWPNIILVLKNEQGQTQEQVTDDKGRVTFAGLRSGSYTVTFKIKEKDQTEPRVFWETAFRLASGQEERLTIDFKKEYEKQTGAQAEARKKQEEESKKFEGMKEHFDQGRAALDQSRQIQTEMAKAPADQRAALSQQAATLRQTAISEFQAAQAAAGEKDENLHLIMANLALAYEANGQYAEAEAAYLKALELQPTQTNYVVGLGNVQARLGKVTDAMSSCGKTATTGAADSATCYRNIGIILYNTNRLKEAIEPFKKATTLDPSNADQWYLLGASLVAAMESKQQGDKIQYIVAPGTAEAYAKYLEMAPRGRFAAEAQGALEMLESLGAGTSTKMKVAKKKN